MKELLAYIGINWVVGCTLFTTFHTLPNQMAKYDTQEFEPTPINATANALTQQTTTPPITTCTPADRALGYCGTIEPKYQPEALKPHTDAPQKAWTEQQQRDFDYAQYRARVQSGMLHGTGADSSTTPSE